MAHTKNILTLFKLTVIPIYPSTTFLIFHSFNHSSKKIVTYKKYLNLNLDNDLVDTFIILHCKAIFWTTISFDSIMSLIKCIQILMCLSSHDTLDNYLSGLLINYHNISSYILKIFLTPQAYLLTVWVA